MTLIIQRPSMMEIIKTIEILRKRQKRRRILIAIAVVLAFLLMAVFVASKTVAVPTRYSGSAMSDTLKDGDLTLVNMMKYNPGRGDVVACNLRDQGDGLMFRRVIGISGDTVSIDPATGVVSVNGEALDEDYVTQLAVGNMDTETTVDIPEGYVYLLGDNRPDSLDSRSKQIGLVLESKIRGRVWYVLSPGLHRVR